MRTSFFALLIGSVPLAAHVVSMSTGELRVDGPLAEYELRMPMYEVAHVANRAAILDHIRFEGGHRTAAKCVEEDETYVCRASYEFPTLVPNRLVVECTFFEITVPNHIHLLHAMNGSYSDQEVFDQSFPRGAVRFRPPSRFEAFAREFGGGAVRAATRWVQLLFLFAIAIAARSRKEVLLSAAALIAAEAAAVWIGAKIPWPLSPKFLEAAMALTVAYLAVEIVFLPEGKHLPVVVAVLGVVHGMNDAAFPVGYRLGAWVLQIAALGVFAMIASRAGAPARRVIAWILLVAGIAWFAAQFIR